MNKDSAVYRMIMEEKEGGGSTQLNHVEQQQPYRKGNQTFLTRTTCFVFSLFREGYFHILI